jgi:ribosomal protein L15
VPTLEDETVAKWMRPSSDEEVDYVPKGTGSGSGATGATGATGAMKRRSPVRPRTTRDLQAGR